MDQDKLNQLIDERALKVAQQFLRSNGFTALKRGDTPNDALALIPRKYLTNNGLVANRPLSSVATVGQPYLATDTKIPMTYTAAGWVNGSGSIVALNN